MLKAVVVTALLALIASMVVLNATNAQLLASPSGAQKRLGLWIDERDIWSGEPGLDWTPQQFVDNYFKTSPYPSAMLFATGMDPTGPALDLPTPLGEAQWLASVAGICERDGLNVKIIILFFVNLSGETIDGVPDQTQLLTDYMSQLKGHPAIYGAQYEREYFGATSQEFTTFRNIVTAVGYVDVVDSGASSLFPSDPVLGYSEYPYFTGQVATSGPSGGIGVGYGEIGSPPRGGQAWTKSTVTAIIDNSFGSPYVLLYAGDGGANQPTYRLWNWPTLHWWIWSDPNYQANYILSMAPASSVGSSMVGGSPAGGGEGVPTFRT